MVTATSRSRLQIPVITDHITFLRVPINQPFKQFSFLCDIISNFHFPLVPARLPLTVMRHIVSQCVISKLRPHLALQSISNSHALHLDSLLASKIHQHLHFPFQFPTTLLSTPLDLRGLGFPSISCLNASLAVSGLHRDLTHHLPSFQNMALITLLDWTCLFNRCVHPLSPPYSLTRTPNSHHSHLLPFSWLLAVTTLSTLQLSLQSTDLSFLLHGHVSLQHLHTQFKTLLPKHPSLPTRLSLQFHQQRLLFSSSIRFLYFPPIHDPNPSLPPFPITFSPSPLLFDTRLANSLSLAAIPTHSPLPGFFPGPFFTLAPFFSPKDC